MHGLSGYFIGVDEGTIKGQDRSTRPRAANLDSILDRSSTPTRNKQRNRKHLPLRPGHYENVQIQCQGNDNAYTRIQESASKIVHPFGSQAGSIYSVVCTFCTKWLAYLPLLYLPLHSTPANAVVVAGMTGYLAASEVRNGTNRV